MARSRKGKRRKQEAKEARSEMGMSYSGRNEILLGMGFKDYAAYLASPRWFKIRARVFEERGRSCSVCGEAADQVHHTRYAKADLVGSTLNEMWPICRPCHEAVEFDVDGKKVLDVRRCAAAFHASRAAGKVVKAKASAIQPRRKAPPGKVVVLGPKTPAPAKKKSKRSGLPIEYPTVGPAADRVRARLDDQLRQKQQTPAPVVVATPSVVVSAPPLPSPARRNEKAVRKAIRHRAARAREKRLPMIHTAAEGFRGRLAAIRAEREAEAV